MTREGGKPSADPGNAGKGPCGGTFSWLSALSKPWWGGDSPARICCPLLKRQVLLPRLVCLWGAPRSHLHSCTLGRPRPGRADSGGSPCDSLLCWFLLHCHVPRLPSLSCRPQAG